MANKKIKIWLIIIIILSGLLILNEINIYLRLKWIEEAFRGSDENLFDRINEQHMRINNIDYNPIFDCCYPYNQSCILYGNKSCIYPIGEWK